jgi:hypothetical protein
LPTDLGHILPDFALHLPVLEISHNTLNCRLYFTTLRDLPDIIFFNEAKEVRQMQDRRPAADPRFTPHVSQCS